MKSICYNDYQMFLQKKMTNGKKLSITLNSIVNGMELFKMPEKNSNVVMDG